jgi:hypothetical protein
MGLYVDDVLVVSHNPQKNNGYPLYKKIYLKAGSVKATPDYCSAESCQWRDNGGL